MSWLLLPDESIALTISVHRLGSSINPAVHRAAVQLTLYMEIYVIYRTVQ